MKRFPRFPQFFDRIGTTNVGASARAVDYPYVVKAGVTRLPLVLVLGNGTSPYFPLQTDQWVADALDVDFSPGVTYESDWRTFDPLVTPFADFDSVVWMFDCDNYSTAPSWLPDLLTWVNAGGGLVVTEWLLWQMAIDIPDTTWDADFAAEMPVGPTYGLGNYNPTSTDPSVTDASHPTMRTFGGTIGVPALGSWYASEVTGLVNGGQTVAEVDIDVLGVNPFVAVRDAGSGRLGWANFAYFGDINPGTGTGVAQLLRNMAWWAAGGQ